MSARILARHRRHLDLLDLGLDLLADEPEPCEKCLCRKCGRWFENPAAVDAHRRGPFASRGALRRCVTAAATYVMPANAGDIDLEVRP